MLFGGQRRRCLERVCLASRCVGKAWGLADFVVRWGGPQVRGDRVYMWHRPVPRPQHRAPEAIGPHKRRENGMNARELSHVATSGSCSCCNPRSDVDEQRRGGAQYVRPTLTLRLTAPPRSRKKTGDAHREGCRAKGLRIRPDWKHCRGGLLQPSRVDGQAEERRSCRSEVLPKIVLNRESCELAKRWPRRRGHRLLRRRRRNHFGARRGRPGHT
mmetsp:Transcript_123286/g.348362  ORF Transcript_123286/g.348362 Transcript_123286/m.348362 type:complete len:215 (+) Transcript_123286:825-1469(+)